MALQPYTSFPSHAYDIQPFSDWSMYDPFASRGLYNNPLMKRTAQNAREVVRDMQPILYTDILDKGDSFEVHAGSRKISLILFRTEKSSV